jgi:hypothetical protein
VDILVRGALAKKREARYPDAATFARDAAAVLRGEAPSFRPPAAARARASEGADQGPFGGRQVTLVVEDGPCKGRSFPVTAVDVTLGRTGPGAKADIQIPDTEISRAHAQLTWDGTRFEIRDLGSTNGTIVGIEPIDRCELTEEDDFILGGTRLRLVVT